MKSMKYNIKYITNDYKETQKLGADFGKKILKNTAKMNGAFVVGLWGDLGSGKTTFLQGFAKGIGIKEKILSPTFVILKHFKITKSQITNSKLQTNSKFTDFYHIDCYRLESPEEIMGLGWREIILNPKNIVAIEWPEKIESVLPKDIFKINYKFIDENKREITLDKFLR